MLYEVITVLVSNPLLNARTTVKFHAVKKRRDGSKIFLEKEQDPLEEYLYQQRTVEAYSILLHFQIGTRIGELVALEAEDISDEEIYIHKTEIADKEYINGKYVNKGYKVVEYVKHDIEAGYRTRITSYNVCYTKLLRLSPLLFVNQRFIYPLSANKRA